MALPEAYADVTPTLAIGGLTPLQLALANYLTTGTTPPFGVNQEFLASINKFADSGLLSPTTYDPRTNEPRIPDIMPDVVALAYLTSGNRVYMLRDAQDCGPDGKNRTEVIDIGDITTVAEGSFAYYGNTLFHGTAANGTNIKPTPGSDAG